jgi:DNA-directed RNA polymerase subunit RPC12/RpoP
MEKEKDKKEEKKEEVRELIKCEKCGSLFVYSLISGEIVCRKCSHRTLPKK